MPAPPQCADPLPSMVQFPGLQYLNAGPLSRRSLSAELWDIRIGPHPARHQRSEEHTSELQSLMRNSYAVFCLKKKILASSLTQTHPLHNSTTLNATTGTPPFNT